MPILLKQSMRKTASGKNADLSTIQNDDGGLLLRAVVDGETYEHGVTIGASDQPLPANYDQAAFDAEMDRASSFAAEMAESAARKKALIAGVS